MGPPKRAGKVDPVCAVRHGNLESGSAFHPVQSKHRTFTEKDGKKCPTKKALFEGEAAEDSCHLAVDEKALWALGSGEKTPAGI